MDKEMFNVKDFVNATGIDENQANKYLQTREVTFDFLKRDLACGLDVYPIDYCEPLFYVLAKLEKDIHNGIVSKQDARNRSNLYTKIIKQFVNNGIPANKIMEFLTEYEIRNEGAYAKPHALREFYQSLKQEDEVREEEIIATMVELTGKVQNVLDDVGDSLNKQNSLIEETTSIIKEKEEKLEVQNKEVKKLSKKIEELEQNHQQDSKNDAINEELLVAREQLANKEKENQELAQAIAELKQKVDNITQNNGIEAKLSEIAELQKKLFDEKEKETEKPKKKSFFSGFGSGFNKKQESKEEVVTEVITNKENHTNDTQNFVSIVLKKKYSADRLEMIDNAVKAGVSQQDILEIINGENKEPLDDASFKFAMNCLINQLSKESSEIEVFNE